VGADNWYKVDILAGIHPKANPDKEVNKCFHSKGMDMNAT